MPIYEYSAIDLKGKKTAGSVDAENVRVARQKLRSQNIFPTDITEGKESVATKSKDVLRLFKTDNISLKELAVATRQLATLVGAGLPLVTALQALSDQQDSAALKRIITDVRERVEQGSPLAKAMGEFPKAFPRLFVNMVASGEASGTLEAVLLNLADHLESQLMLRTKVRSALTYPALMLVVCTGVIIGLFIFVIPNIVDIYIKQGAVLPLPTRIMIVLSDFFIGYWYLLVALLFGLGALGRWYYKQESGRERMDAWLLKAPLIGRIYLKIATARVSLTLGTLLGSGVELLTALDITRRVVGNVHVARAMDDAREGVREGRSLARELQKSRIFPSMLCHMIAVGEKSGALEEMLSKAGDAYENEVNATLDGLTTLLEPAMMIGVGGVVLCIVISVLLPMADLIEVIHK